MDPRSASHAPSSCAATDIPIRRTIRLCCGGAAAELWLTPEQAERRGKEDALGRIAELEAELSRRRGGVT